MMDFNREQSENQAQEAQPYRTPYQTPVRHEAGKPAYSMQTEDLQEVPEGKAYASQSYEAKNGKAGNKKKDRPVIIALSLVAAAALFAGGIGIGGLIAATKQPSRQEIETAQTAVESSRDESLPTLSVANTPVQTNRNGQTLAGEEVFEKCVPSMVSIQSSWISAGKSGSGSGVVMSTDGYIITNCHVVQDEETARAADKVTVVLHDGENMPAQIIGTDEDTDLAVLKITPSTALVAAEFGDSDALKPGQICYAIGSPGGLQLANTITTGSISAISRDITINDNVMSLIQTDAAINPGNSGGALINQYGQIVGITSAKLGYYEGLGFAIPISTTKEIVDQLIQHGYIAGRPQIGISGWDIDEASAAYYDVPKGVLIDSIDSRSNAVTAGIRADDIIIGVNGETITTMEEINAVKEEMQAGDRMTLTIYRMSTGEEFDCTFLLNDEHDFQGEDPALAQNNDRVNNRQEQYYYGNGGYSFNPFEYFFGGR